MNAKDLALGIFVVLTVVFASLTAIEFSQNRGTNSATSTTCTATGGIGCPHSLNDSYTISVTYAGPWGLTYAGYLGDSPSGQPVTFGNFYGRTSANETTTVAGVSAIGTVICAEAQKLDASSSALVLSIASSSNQTSVAYGTTRVCVSNVIAMRARADKLTRSCPPGDAGTATTSLNPRLNVIGSRIFRTFTRPFPRLTNQFN